MFNNNPNFNNQFNPFNAGAFVPQQQPLEMRSTLTSEDDAILKQNRNQVDGFFKAPTAFETTQAVCNHKANDGTFSLQKIGDDRYRCTRCGEEFTMISPDNMDEVIEVCQKALDVFNSTKTYYGQSNEEIRNLYKGMTLLKQLPQMFKFASNYFTKGMPQANMGYANSWGTPSNMYYTMTNGAGIPGMSNDDAFNPYAAQPQYYGQPAPAMAPNYGPQQQYYGAPQQPQYGYNGGYAQPAGIPYQQNVAPQSAPAFGQQPAQYTAAANPIGTPMAQQNVAPAPAAAPTATSNVTVGTGQQPVPVCNFSA